MKIRRFPLALRISLLSLCWVGSTFAVDEGETDTEPIFDGTFIWHLGDWTLGVPTVSDTAGRGYEN